MRNADQLTPYEREIGARLTNEQVISEVRKRLYDNLESIYPELPKDNVVINGYTLGGLFAQTFRFVLTCKGKEITAFVKICPMYEGLDPAKMHQYHCTYFILTGIPQSPKQIFPGIP